MQSKADLRLAIRERLARLTQHERDIESRIICREIGKLLGETPSVVGAYLPYLDEPDIRPLIGELTKKGWTIAIPSVRREGMTFWSIDDVSDVRRDPVTNMPQPVGGKPLANEASVTAVIIPARALTRSGDRLGRGNGGYDRWISAQRQRNTLTQYIGVCFDCQLLPTVPIEGHDERLDIILTATKTLTVGKDD